MFANPRMVFSDSQGRIFSHPEWLALGFDGSSYILPKEEEWIPLPRGSSFFFLPGHIAFGFDPADNSVLSMGDDKNFFPACAFLAPGHTRLYLPAAKKTDPKIRLPLWPYTAIGFRQGDFFACALRVDKNRKQGPWLYENKGLIKKGIKEFLGLFPENRLVRHLEHCAMQYNCRNAQNLFLKRWEAGLPVSGACNSRCLGCLSMAKTDCLSSHERISFLPTPKEISQVAIAHLRAAEIPMVSFGQGCEGEPLLQWKVIREAIGIIRSATKRGAIHMNTNGSDPDAIRALGESGLDSVRVGLNSLDPEFYDAYYRPKGYSLKEVLSSIRIASKSGLFVSLNYLTFPGFSDLEHESGRLMGFLKKGNVNMLQMRNLSIDPEVFLSRMPVLKGRKLGILNLINMIRKECPGLKLGYFNPLQPRNSLKWKEL